ncbi:unnamed protein product [Lecanosticta acicola]|uniref:Non-homologous end-joining factor 1 n=1 Tax=Lecanosticta acicola TaxID=111012 RepID=A0AAI8VUN9_9PEZI|nr:unnamed protein product [Lecanosticta acicola]
MELKTPWRSVDVKTSAPHLLVKTEFNDEGYDIQLTDLSRVWGERLGKDALVERAIASRCSIEPSEPDQYRIFVEKITAALKSQKGTTVDLKSKSNGLVLQITAPLPKPLASFTWTIEFVRLPDTAVAAELVNPLLVYANSLQHQIQQLVDELAAKDHVISKITDRLEPTNIKLVDIFPGVINAKASQKGKKTEREQLAGPVKGMANFDENAWRQSNVSKKDTSELTSSLPDVVLKDTPILERPSHHQHAQDEWLLDLDTVSQKDALPGESGPDRDEQALMSRKEGSRDDQFQRQRMPPTLRHRDPTPSTEDEEPAMNPQEASRDNLDPKPPEDDESTADEDDLDAAPSQKPSQTKGRSRPNEEANQPATSKTSRSLGVMGGRHAERPSPGTATEPSPAQTKKKSSRLGAFGGKKKTGSPDEETEAEDDFENGDSPAPSPAKPKQRLGVFGGKSKKSTRSPSPDASGPPTPKPKSKLGTFGGKPKKDNHVDEENEEGSGQVQPVSHVGGPNVANTISTGNPEPERTSRAAEKQDEIQERENSEERADKRRKRLRRELDEKSKVPVKKKRKF